jgi:hypothetical protein
MKSKNDLGRFSGQKTLEHTTERPTQDYPPDQLPTNKKIKVKGGPQARIGRGKVAPGVVIKQLGAITPELPALTT